MTALDVIAGRRQWSNECADALEGLARLPDGVAQTAVTSPPYWGLRDYGTGRWEGGDPACAHLVRPPGSGLATVGIDGGTHTQGHQQEGYRDRCRRCGAKRVDRQLGLEVTPDEYVARVCRVLFDVRRVLRDDGTLWLNLGDCFPTGAGAVGTRPGGGERGDQWLGLTGRSAPDLPGSHRRYRGNHADDPKRASVPAAIGPMTQPNRLPQPGLKPKDLVGMPWRVVFALQGFALVRIDELAALCRAIDVRDFPALDAFRAGFRLWEELAGQGWLWHRMDNIWSKPNPMPDPTTDRPTHSHEYVFLLTKSGRVQFWTHRYLSGTRRQPRPDWRWQDRAHGNVETEAEPADWRTATLPDGRKRWRRVNLWRGYDYFYDHVAISEPLAKSSIDRISQKTFEAQTGGPKDCAVNNLRDKQRQTAEQASEATPRRLAGFNDRWSEAHTNGHVLIGRHRRSVWTVSTEAFPEAHFATFPTGLVEPPILAGTSTAGACPACGAPWARRSEPTGLENRREPARSAGFHAPTKTDSTGWRPTSQATVRWAPTCDCEAGDPIPCLVIDPFSGAATTGLVAVRLGRRFVGFDLKAEYVELGARRIVEDAPLLHADLGRPDATAAVQMELGAG